MSNFFDDGGLRVMLVGGIVLTAFQLAMTGSSYLIDFYMVVVCTNRFIRRVMDWAEGQYDPTPLISLTPVLVGGMAVLAVASRFPQLPPRSRQAASCVVGGLGYSMVFGISNGFAAFYSLAQFLMPFGILFYAVLMVPSDRMMRRWLLTLTTMGVLVAGYGIFQWATIPPWDEAWVEWSGMWSSMGHPIPFKFKICSTLESRGPFSWFMATAAIPMCCAARYRRFWGVAGTGLILFAALLSGARSSWGFLILGVVFFVALRGGRGLIPIAVTVAAFGVGLTVLVPMLPESQRIVERVETFQNLGEDQSFNARLHIAEYGIGMMLSHPQGHGMGSAGMAAQKLGSGAVMGDNGYLTLLAELGIPGFALFFYGLFQIVREVFEAHREGNDYATLGLAMLASGMVFLIIGRWIVGPYAGMMFMILGGAIGYERWLDETAEDEDDIDDDLEVPPRRGAAQLPAAGTLS